MRGTATVRFQIRVGPGTRRCQPQGTSRKRLRATASTVRPTQLSDCYVAVLRARSSAAPHRSFEPPRIVPVSVTRLWLAWPVPRLAGPRRDEPLTKLQLRKHTRARAQRERDG